MLAFANHVGGVSVFNDGAPSFIVSQPAYVLPQPVIPKPSPIVGSAPVLEVNDYLSAPNASSIAHNTLVPTAPRTPGVASMTQTEIEPTISVEGGANSPPVPIGSNEPGLGSVAEKMGFAVGKFSGTMLFWAVLILAAIAAIFLA